VATATLDYELQRLVRTGIPGYDPFAQAGDCVFDEEKAASAVAFIERYCSHVTDWHRGHGGQPMLLEPWQRAIVANLWGWLRPDGMRRYRECLIFIPRKNGKTLLAAALVVLVMYMDGERGAQCYSSASERDQARLCFHVVSGMIGHNADLAAHATVQRSNINVGHPIRGAHYRALSAEAGSKHGYNAHLVVNDELHTQRTRALTDALATSQLSKPQPLLIHLTTSDYEREGSICNTKHDYASSVRDNGGDPNKPGHDPAFLPVIYEADRADDWTDPEVWRKANPNLGVSISEEALARECQRAQEEPEFENEFKRLHLNLRTEQAFRWMPMAAWDACDTPVDAKALLGQPCWGGLDLATVSDMAAFVLCFKVGEQFHLLPWFWCPEETAGVRQRKERQPYLTWAKAGLLELTPGNRIVYSHIRHRINELGKQYKIQAIAYDSWNASTISQQLHDEDGFECVEFRQGFNSMNEPMKHVMRLVLGGELCHGGNPVLRWNANNLAAKKDASDNIRPDKEHSWEKIDGMVAAIMSVGMAMQAPVKRRSVYETRGLVVG